VSATGGGVGRGQRHRHRARGDHRQDITTPLHHQGYRGQGHGLGLSPSTDRQSRPAASSMSIRRSAKGTTFRISSTRKFRIATRCQAPQSPGDHRARHRRRHLRFDRWCARPHRPDRPWHILWSRTRRGWARRSTPAGSSRAAITVIEGRQTGRGARGAGQAGREVDLVVSDVVMPEMKGRRCSRSCARSTNQDHLRSGYDEEAFEKSCRIPISSSSLPSPSPQADVAKVKDTMAG